MIVSKSPSGSLAVACNTDDPAYPGPTPLWRMPPEFVAFIHIAALAAQGNIARRDDDLSHAERVRFEVDPASVELQCILIAGTRMEDCEKEAEALKIKISAHSAHMSELTSAIQLEREKIRNGLESLRELESKLSNERAEMQRSSDQLADASRQLAELNEAWEKVPDTYDGAAGDE